MGQQRITIQLPDDLYERVKKVADVSNRPLQAILVESLDLLFGGSSGDEIHPDDMSDWTDEQLLAFVHRRRPWTEAQRLHELNARNKGATLTEEEQDELDHLLARV